MTKQETIRFNIVKQFPPARVAADIVIVLRYCSFVCLGLGSWAGCIELLLETNLSSPRLKQCSQYNPGAEIRDSYGIDTEVFLISAFLFI
jgi:hypothetical protein